MKTLFLVRHAKSSWADPTLADRDRPLNDRGRRDAPEMGRRLAARGLDPDALVSSPAVRARTTAEVVAGALGRDPGSIALDERVYGAGPSTLLDVVRGFRDEWETVLLFGHNPGFTDLANELGDRDFDNVRTCGVVEIAFDVDRWADVRRGLGRTVSADDPKRKR